MSSETSAAMQSFADLGRAGAEHLTDATLQLAAALAGESQVIAEGQLGRVDRALGLSVHSRHIDETMLSPEAQGYIGTAKYIVEAIALGVQAQIGKDKR